MTIFVGGGLLFSRWLQQEWEECQKDFREQLKKQERNARLDRYDIEEGVELTRESTQFNSESDTLGISVGYLKDGFLQEVLDAGMSKDSKIYEIEDLSEPYVNGIIRAKGANQLCPIDGHKGASYVHSLGLDSDKVGQATFMLSYSWGYTIGDIVDTLLDHCKSQKLNPYRTYVWICCLCVNQHRVVENRLQGKEVPFQEFRKLFYHRVTTIGHILAMMSPWFQPAYLTRVWCVFEIFTAASHKTSRVNVTIVMPPREKVDMIKAIIGDVHAGIDQLYTMLANTKIENANASVEDDKTNILKVVNDGHSYKALNLRVNELLRAWVRDTIADVSSKVISNHKALHSAQTACAFNNFGHLFFRNGEVDLALQHYQNALQQSFGANIDPRIRIQTYNNIGKTLTVKGEYDAACRLLRDALAMSDHCFGSNHIESAQSHEHIGTVMKQRGRPDVALQEYQLALSIRLREHGMNHHETVVSYTNIGCILKDRCDYQTAIKNFRKARTIREGLFGTNHPDWATSCCNIGDILLVTGKYTDAVQEYQKACNIYETVLGTNHITTAQIYGKIGLVLGYLGRHLDARGYLNEALVIHESLLGKDHFLTGKIYEKLGLLLLGTYRLQRHVVDIKTTDRLHQALELFHLALEIYERDNTQHRTAKCYHSIGKANKALDKLEPALDGNSNAAVWA